MPWTPRQLWPGKGEPIVKILHNNTPTQNISTKINPEKGEGKHGPPGQTLTGRRQPLGKFLQPSSIQRKTKGYKCKDGMCVGPHGSYGLEGGNPLEDFPGQTTLSIETSPQRSRKKIGRLQNPRAATA